jgi:hypothetical protein
MANGCELLLLHRAFVIFLEPSWVSRDGWYSSGATVVTTMPTSEAEALPPPPLAKETLTELTHMLLNVAPLSFGSNTTASTATTKTTADSLYEQHYKHAYRRCQDRPGGTYLLYIYIYIYWVGWCDYTVLCIVLKCTGWIRVIVPFLVGETFSQVRYYPDVPKRGTKPTPAVMLVVVLMF